jgi:hypothetical protein
MKNTITSNPVQQWRVLFAVALGLAALVCLLSLCTGLPTAEARGPATANTGGLYPHLFGRSTITYYIYLPLVFKSDLVYSDDFSRTSSGWPHNQSYEDENGRCEFKYNNGHYRVKVTDVTQGRAMRCIIPNLSIPKQVNGTFKVNARRTSDQNPFMLYGFIFGAGTDATRNRWALEVHPKKDSNCDSKPFYWLVATVSGDPKYFRDRCTNEIDVDEDAWNSLMVIRNGSNVRVYINGDPEGNYSDASYLLNEGYFDLQVVSDGIVTVEFDNVEIRSGTTPP